jgi:hypothetical protein
MKQLAVVLLITAASLVVTAAGVGITAASPGAAKNLVAGDAPEKLFRIGMTQPELSAAFGEAQSYFDVEKQRRLTRKEYLAAGDACKCRPLYNRKTAKNEYEIMAYVRPDNSASRLHPVLRVNEVRFTLDRDMSPEEALDDIAEAKALCAGHCTRGEQLGFTVFTRPEIEVAFAVQFSAKNPSKVEWISMWAKK